MLEQLDAGAVQSTTPQMLLELQGYETVVTGFCTLHLYITLAVSIFF